MGTESSAHDLDSREGVIRSLIHYKSKTLPYTHDVCTYEGVANDHIFIRADASMRVMKRTIGSHRIELLSIRCSTIWTN